MENTGGYVPSSVYAQGCGSFSNGSNNYNPTPSTPPSYTPPTPPAPVPAPTPQPSIPTGVDDIDESDQNDFNNFKNNYQRLNIPYDNSGIDVKITQLTNNIQNRYESLTSDVLLDCSKYSWASTLKCGSRYTGALWNMFVIYCRYLFGILKGLAVIAAETVFDLLTLPPSIRAAAQDAVYNTSTPTVSYYKMTSLFTKNSLKGLVIKAGEIISIGSLTLVDTLISQSLEDWFSIFDKIGYWIGYVGGSLGLVVWSIVTTIITVGATIEWSTIALGKLAKSISGLTNVAKSITNSANEIRIGSLIIRNVLSSQTEASILGQEVLAIYRAGRIEQFANLTNSSNKYVLALRNKNTWLPNFNPIINVQKQNKHILGTAQYVEGKSILTANPQALMDQFKGAGLPRLDNSKNLIPNVEFVDFGYIIGEFKSNGVSKGLTTKGRIIHGQTGSHIIPTAP